MKFVFQWFKCKIFFNDSKLSQIITEHDKFKSYLHKFKLTDSDICTCGQDVENIKHVLSYCKLFLCKRDKFRKKLERLSVSWPLDLSSLRNCI